MELQKKILDDMNHALKSGDKLILETIRMLRAQIKNESISKGVELTDDDVIVVLSREAKRRKESIEMYQQGGREDLVRNETRELEIISSYLPVSLTTEELTGIVEEAIQETGAAGLNDMGKVMGFVMPKVRGRADGKTVQEMVKKMLG